MRAPRSTHVGLALATAFAIPSRAQADPLPLPKLGVTIDVPAGWRLSTEPGPDLLFNAQAKVVRLDRDTGWASCNAVIRHLLLEGKATPTAKPAFLGAAWYADAATLPEFSGVTMVCADTPRGPLSVAFTMDSLEARAILDAVVAVLSGPAATGTVVAELPPPVTAPPPTAVPPPDAVPPPVSVPPATTAAPESVASPAPAGASIRQRLAGLRVGVGYDSVTPTASTMLEHSHYNRLDLEDSKPFGSGDVLAAVSLGFGDKIAYDVQLDIGPSIGAGGLTLSALVGVGHDSVGGTMTQFQQTGGTYLQFLGRVGLAVGPITVTGSAAVLDHETRATADLVWHVPGDWLRSVAIGLRYTKYDLATRTGVMLTLGL